MIRAVIDTNVLVSGLLSPSGNEALTLLAIHRRWLRPCLSQEILDEYEAVLARPKLPCRSEMVRPLTKRQGVISPKACEGGLHPQPS